MVSMYFLMENDNPKFQNFNMPNEQAASTATSMVEIGTDAFMGVEDLLHGCNNCKTTYNKISI
jgi:hypothetical protein